MTKTPEPRPTELDYKQLAETRADRVGRITDALARIVLKAQAEREAAS